MTIVFLNNGNKYSKMALSYLSTFNCNVIVGDNKKKFDYPEKYDLGIGFLYSHLVPEHEINKTKWINFHPGILPIYGGRNISYHIIMNNEKEAGSTIHFMNKDFDGGDIIDIKKFKIKNMTAHEIYNKSCEMLFLLLEEYLSKFLRNEDVKSNKQGEKIYYKQIKINDFIKISKNNEKKILALTFPPHYPKIKIGNRIFNIIPE